MKIVINAIKQNKHTSDTWQTQYNSQSKNKQNIYQDSSLKIELLKMRGVQ